MNLCTSEDRFLSNLIHNFQSVKISFWTYCPFNCSNECLSSIFFDDYYRA